MPSAGSVEEILYNPSDGRPLVYTCVGSVVVSHGDISSLQNDTHNNCLVVGYPMKYKGFIFLLTQCHQIDQ